MTTIAFHGEKATQAKYVSRVEGHYELDEIIKGKYWQNGKGCAVGCAVHVPGLSVHQAFADQLGFPLQITHLVDAIFENLPDEKAKDWPIAVVTAPRLGADLSGVWPQFAIWLMTDTEYGVENTTDDLAIKSLCREVAEGYRTGQTTGPQAEALADRLRAARAAWDARDARAARAAWDARDARAARAAWAAWDAWDARAARAAWDARDARAAFVEASADELLRLLIEAPVK